MADPTTASTSTDLDPRRIRRSYDRVAERYAEEFIDELERKPLDRALLSVVADDVRQRGGGPIVDLGAGPAQVAAFLGRSEAQVAALDLSPAMATIALHRLGVPAVAGSLATLPFGPGSLAGGVAFYCLIHLDDDGLRAAVVELARVIRPGGPLLVAFHVGEEVRHLDEWWDEEVDVDFRFLEPRPVADQLAGAGFAVEAVLERAPYPGEVDTHRAYVLARRHPG